MFNCVRVGHIYNTRTHAHRILGVFILFFVYICACVKICTFSETGRLKYIILNTQIHLYIKVIRAHRATFMASYSHRACIEVRQGEVTTSIYVYIIYSIYKINKSFGSIMEINK